jgi:hypothetical protein
MLMGKFSPSHILSLFILSTKFDLLDRTKRAQNRTFDSTILSIDISNFISTLHTEDGNHIRILSNFDDIKNRKSIKSCNEFTRYYGK